MLQLPTESRTERTRHFTLRVRKRTLWLGLLLGPIAAAVLFAQVAQVDFRDQRAVYFKVQQAQESAGQLVHDITHLRTKLRASWGAKPDRLVLDVKSKHWQQVVDKRNAALDRGLLFTDSEDFVPAQFGDGTSVVDAKIRLKGDLLDHLKHPDRWSFRVKIRGDHAYHGMRRFSLQPPATRNYLNEWVLHRMVKDEGLIGLRYDFVQLTLNGNDLGVYALEEHFAKQVIESNQRREGPIVRFEETTLWGVHQLDPEDAYYSAPITGFELKSALEDPVGRGLFQLAAAQLRGLRDGTKPLDEVFDLAAVAHYFAICDLLGAQHGISYNNLRFYFDPVDALFEPVAYDGIAGDRIAAPAEARANALGIDGQAFLRVFFADPSFCAHYHRSLARVTEESFLGDFLERWATDIERHQQVIRSQYPQVRLDTQVFADNRQVIERFLAQSPDLAIYPHAVGTLDIVNLEPRMMSLTGVITETGAVVPIDPPLSIPPFRSGAPTRAITIALPALVDPDSTMTSVRTEPIGLDRPRDVPVSDFPLYQEFTTIPRVSTARSFPWIETIERETVTHFVVPAGTWRLDRDLVLLATERLILAAGAQIDLVEGAQIISYGGITAAGTAEQPIRVTSSDGRGLGLFVTGSPLPSQLRYVTFENLSHPRAGVWAVTGAVTFHESEVAFDHCNFIANRSEDALNIIRSEFSIGHCTFKETYSDALDCDFAEGVISHSAFLDSGNDAIDTSGSSVRVEHVFIRGAGDKGLSAGEGSDLSSSDTTIEGVEIAVASKDDSRIVMTNLVISEARLGFAVYNKKPEYGPGRVDAHFSPSHTGGHPTFLLEDDSTLNLDGEPQAPNQRNVVDDLYGEKYGKSSE